MNITYPIFLQGKDKYLYLFYTDAEINKHIEHIDIIDKEYTAWDSQGYPVNLSIREGKIECEIIRNTAQINDLINALTDYAKLRRVDTSNIDYHNDVQHIFRYIENAQKKNTIIYKLSHLFQK